MKTHDISDYPEVFRKADLVKVLPDVIVRELKMSTNIDFEKDSHSEIRDMVTTIVCNHMNAACYMGKSPEGGWQITGKSKGKGKPTEHATTAGRRVTDAETSGEREEQRQMGTEWKWRIHQERARTRRRQVRERVRFAVICTSAAACVAEDR